MSKIFIQGQRWMSETEPELGLGIINQVEDKTIQVLFNASETSRVYGINTAPLKRVLFEVEDKVRLNDGTEIIIENIEQLNGIAIYQSHNGQFPEMLLADELAFNNPEQKLFNGQVDSERFYQLRFKALEMKKRWSNNSARGFVGPRISFIPHQYYVAKKVCELNHPRVLLADEVGLGKTIESGMILHHMIQTSRIKRALILVPDSLVYQWFFELHRKFSMGFVAINQETYLEKDSNPFVDNERVIVSLGLLKGSQVARELLKKADFDMVIVDEAHLYEWHSQKENQSFEYEFLEDITKRIPSVLLLTATPEQVGMEGHFARLRLLDPNRFDNLERFKNDVGHYRETANISRKIFQNESLSEAEKKSVLNNLSVNEDHFNEKLKTDKGRWEILDELIDQHGTGRIFFRNTRQVMRKEYDFFPKRILHTYPMKSSVQSFDHEVLGLDQKVEWLGEFLKGTKDKVLLICHSKESVLKIEKYLKENTTGIEASVFHSGLSLMARDRQAAYFADPKGAQILLCTEIGSEGRNFEFAHHLVLMDLPKKPDLLEQRIGRLDRIGQKSDIHLHVPFVENSWEEKLFSIYHEGLQSFEKFSSVGTPTFVHFHSEIHQILENQDNENFDNLLNQLKSYREKLEQSLEESRDFLIELNSYRPTVAHDFLSTIRDQENPYLLQDYMEEIFENFGVDIEELGAGTYFIRPNDNMFIPHFPCLESEGMTITFNRREALEREDIHFISWDHPMVTGITDFICSDSIGNATVAMRKAPGKNSKSFVEAMFLLQCVGADKFQLDKFFPPTLVRVLIDRDGVDFDQKWDKSTLDEKITQADKETLARAIKIPKDLIKELLSKASRVAQEKSQEIIQKYLNEATTYLSNEKMRLIKLQKLNSLIKDEEIEFMTIWQEEVESIIKRTNVQLDSFRLIL